MFTTLSICQTASLYHNAELYFKRHKTHLHHNVWYSELSPCRNPCETCMSRRRGSLWNESTKNYHVKRYSFTRHEETLFSFQASSNDVKKSRWIFSCNIHQGKLNLLFLWCLLLLCKLFDGEVGTPDFCFSFNSCIHFMTNIHPISKRLMLQLLLPHCSSYSYSDFPFYSLHI